MPEPIQFTQSSPRHKLPFLFAAQTQKEFFVNEALVRADMLFHPAIEGEQPAPPSDPNDGESWIVAAGATGVWEGRDNQIAGWQAGSWQFIGPTNGMRVWDKPNGQFLLHNDGWQRPAGPAEPVGGTTQDAELRAAFSELLETLANAGIIPVT